MIEVRGKWISACDEILTKEAQEFLASLHRKFNTTRLKLLDDRVDRKRRLDQGESFAFLKETAGVRKENWKILETPADLQDRRVEITGPAEAKMLINALNCGAKVFMADIEDALSPTWENVINGQKALKEAVRHTLEFTSPEGKKYSLKEKIATLKVRPRGWHLEERNFFVDGKPMSGSLFDFGLYFFHNAGERIKRKTAPYFYLPKMESHLEARLWNDVFVFAQKEFGISNGTIKSTVLIETIPAAFEMDEILFELKDHIVGLNAGRWDYIFSCIKKFSNKEGVLFPDRAQVTMAVPFMKSYAELLVKTCHRRGAHAMGGMAAFIPNRKDPEVTANALAKVTEDKKREASQGFDGTWVAHPDLVAIAQVEFDKVLGTKPNQVSKQRDDVNVEGKELITFTVDGGKITEGGFRNNVNVALQYADCWLRGIGAAAIHNLMEDAATAEISRAQLWQWIRTKAQLDDGRVIGKELYQKISDEEFKKLGGSQAGRLGVAKKILDQLVLEPEFREFLTLPAYEMLDKL